MYTGTSESLAAHTASLANADCASLRCLPTRECSAQPSALERQLPDRDLGDPGQIGYLWLLAEQNEYPDSRMRPSENLAASESVNRRPVRLDGRGLIDCSTCRCKARLSLHKKLWESHEGQCEHEEMFETFRSIRISRSPLDGTPLNREDFTHQIVPNLRLGSASTRMGQHLATGLT